MLKVWRNYIGIIILQSVRIQYSYQSFGIVRNSSVTVINKTLIACDLGGTKLLVRIQNDDMQVDRKYQTGIDFTPSQLKEIIQQLEQEFSLSDYQLAVAFPGLLKGKQCYISNVVPQFNQYHLQELTEKGELVLVINDVEAATYGILNSHCAENTNDKHQYQVEILIMSGTGIGMGIAIDGKVFRGEHGFSGELGSCKVEKEGEYFRLAQLASGGALSKSHHIHDHHHPLCKESCGRRLGEAVSWVVNCFNPGRIVFAGGMFNEIEYQEACFKAIKELSLQQLIEPCKLELETEMKTIVLRGLKNAVQINLN